MYVMRRTQLVEACVRLSEFEEERAVGGVERKRLLQHPYGQARPRQGIVALCLPFQERCTVCQPVRSRDLCCRVEA